MIKVTVTHNIGEKYRHAQAAQGIVVPTTMTSTYEVDTIPPRMLELPYVKLTDDGSTVIIPKDLAQYVYYTGEKKVNGGRKGDGYTYDAICAVKETVWKSIITTQSDHPSLQDIYDILIQHYQHYNAPNPLTEEDITKNIQAREEAAVKNQKKMAEKKQHEAEKERQIAEGIEKLEKWAMEHGSELLRARIEEKVKWIDLAEREYFTLHTPAGYETIPVDSGEERLHPDMPEILEMRRIRKEIENSHGILANARYAWNLIRSENEEEDDDKFATVDIDIVAPTRKIRTVSMRFPR